MMGFIIRSVIFFAFLPLFGVEHVIHRYQVLSAPMSILSTKGSASSANIKQQG